MNIRYEPTLLGSFGSIEQTFFSSIRATGLICLARRLQDETTTRWNDPFSIIESCGGRSLDSPSSSEDEVHSFSNMLSFSTTSRWMR